MRLAHKVLHNLGATQVFKVEEYEDPKTEEEFNLLEYESRNKITWKQYQEKYPEIEKTVGLHCLRAHRNRLLTKSDWIMTVDSFESLKNKDEWVAYRKALRDITINPPPFVWKGSDLDVQKMFPEEPKVIR
jgi:hypothetical protein